MRDKHVPFPYDKPMYRASQWDPKHSLTVHHMVSGDASRSKSTHTTEEYFIFWREEEGGPMTTTENNDVAALSF